MHTALKPRAATQGRQEPNGAATSAFSSLTQRESVPATSEGTMDESEPRREGLRWLTQLRWWALSGTMAGVFLSQALSWSFVSTAGIVAGVLVMGVVNVALLWRIARARAVGNNELSVHAAVDLVFLTWLLAWSGGIENPICVAYSFHVVLGALLNGRRGAIVSTLFSAACIALLWGLERAGGLPSAELVAPPRALWALSLALLLGGLGYLALVVAERQAEQNALTLQQQRASERSIAVLLESLAALRVGLVLEDSAGVVQLENETARALLSHEVARKAAHQVGPAENSSSHRFAVETDPKRGERIIDLLALPNVGTAQARALLFVDRTDELLVNQRHVMLERLATLGRALQGVAHELNTPLTTMQTLGKDLRAALAAAPLPAPLRKDVDESLALLIEESQRCRSLTQALLSQASDGRSRGATASGQTLLDVARRAVRLVGAAAGDGVQMDERALDVPVPGDADRVLQIVMNLVQNALRATDNRATGDRPTADRVSAGRAGPRVRVTAETRADELEVRVEDNGPGLPQEVRARLFEPFVTTRPMGEGTGLGLYTSQMIAGELGGALAIDDGPQGGTVCRLTLPLRGIRT